MGNDLRLLIAGKDIDDSIHGLGGIDGVQGADHQVTRFCCGDGGANGLQIAQFTDEDHIWILTQGMLQGGGNALRAVVSQRLLPRAGTEGRALATEVMVMNHAVRAVLRSRKFEQIPGLMQIGSNEGMHTLDESLADLVLTSQITVDEALAHARDPHVLESRLSPSQR